jgi:hypothetical protein
MPDHRRGSPAAGHIEHIDPRNDRDGRRTQEHERQQRARRQPEGEHHRFLHRGMGGPSGDGRPNLDDSSTFRYALAQGYTSAEWRFQSNSFSWSVRVFEQGRFRSASQPGRERSRRVEREAAAETLAAKH